MYYKTIHAYTYAVQRTNKRIGLKIENSLNKFCNGNYLIGFVMKLELIGT